MQKYVKIQVVSYLFIFFLVMVGMRILHWVINNVLSEILTPILVSSKRQDEKWLLCDYYFLVCSPVAIKYFNR